MCKYRCRTSVGGIVARRSRCFLGFSAWLECRVGDEGAGTARGKPKQAGQGCQRPKVPAATGPGPVIPVRFSTGVAPVPFRFSHQRQVENKEARVIQLPGNDPMNVFSPKSSHQP